MVAVLVPTHVLAKAGLSPPLLPPQASPVNRRMARVRSMGSPWRSSAHRRGWGEVSSNSGRRSLVAVSRGRRVGAPRLKAGAVLARAAGASLNLGADLP